MIKKYELISHTADMQLRVYGATLSDLFKHAVVGMFQSIGPKSPHCHYKDGQLECKELPQFHTISIAAKNLEFLMVDFLSRALYLSDIYNEAYLNAIIHELTQKKITATLYGISINGFEIEIKAVTYNNLSVKKINDHWQADIVFDI